MPGLMQILVMRILLSALVVLLGSACVGVRGQEAKFNSYHHAPDECTGSSARDCAGSGEPVVARTKTTKNIDACVVERRREKSRSRFVEADPVVKKREVDGARDAADREVGKPSREKGKEKFYWKPALIQSFEFLGIQHGFRVLAQKHTRAGLGGPFFRDWAQSVRNLRGWNDGNNFFTNYVAHPLQGGLTGRIFIANSDRARGRTFGKSKKYWKSRFKATAWSAFWSTQFELGPISEANIGNVGLLPKRGHSPMAYVDLVVTPLAGTAVLVAEDAVDKYILKDRLESKGGSKTKIKALRSLLTPTISILNLLRGKAPWQRDDR